MTISSTVFSHILCHLFFLWACYFAQSYPSLCDPMDCNLAGLSVHGILQAWILEWVAIPSSKGSSWPEGWTPCVLGLLHCRQVLDHLHHPLLQGLKLDVIQKVEGHCCSVLFFLVFFSYACFWLVSFPMFSSLVINFFCRI